MQKRRVLKALRTPAAEVELNPVDSYMPIASFENALRHGMTFGLRGVHLLTLPPNNGKTTAATRVANKLVAENRISGSVYVDLSNESSVVRGTDVSGTSLSLSRLFAQSLDVDTWRLFAEKKAESVIPQDSSSKPVVFIGDNADDFVLKHDIVRADLVSLATKSVMTKQFCVLLMFRDAGKASVVSRWNGNQKIRLCPRRHDDPAHFRPTEDEMREAVAKQKLSHLSPDSLAALTDLAVSARSVGFVADAGQVLRDMHIDNIPVDASSLHQLLAPELAEAQAHWESWLAVMRRSPIVYGAC